MRQADASHVSESVPVITVRVKCRKPTASFRMTRTMRTVSRTEFGQQTEFRALDSTGRRA
eukprot:7945752-Pyramimonas_sp.AAC.1